MFKLEITIGHISFDTPCSILRGEKEVLGFGRTGLRVSLVTFGPGSGAGLGHHRPHLQQSPLSPGTGGLLKRGSSTRKGGSKRGMRVEVKIWLLGQKKS